MKKNKINISTTLFVLVIAGLMIFNACNKDDVVYERTRLFQPVLNEDLYSIENTIVVNLGKMTEAKSYTLEVSRDTFQTIDYTFDTDTNFVIINQDLIGEELLWYTIYQIRVTAHADDSQYDSKASDLGNVRTQKFPSNMGAPTSFDVLDSRAKVFWTPAGAPITAVKVFAGTDLRLTNALATYELTPEQQESALIVVSNLEASTGYQIAIYSEDVLRGWELYTTKEALVSGDNVVDLTGIDTIVNLANVIPDIADGSIIMLEGGKTYLAGGYYFDKSVSFISGYSFTPALPIIDMTSNFNLNDGSDVGYVTFKDVKLTAPEGYDGRYVFNINKSGSIGEIKFESCIIRTLRGVTRMKGGTGSLDKYTFIDCKIDSIRDYGIITVDKSSWICNDIHIENSTISKARMLFTSRNNSNSITIESSTISEAPESGRQMFRWREEGQNDVLNGITITNTIWGHGWDEEGKEEYLVNGFDGLPNTNFIILNTYTTSDYGIAEGKNEIPGFPSVTYSGTAADLWVDPYNSVFDIKDLGFAGKGDSGDPRWRVGL